MKAAVYDRYGGPDVVRIAEVPKPAPRDREVLVRVVTTTVSAADWRLRALDVPAGFGPIVRLMFGVTGPRQPILGTELAGVVEATGSRATRFRPGDAVVAFVGARLGCHAEYRAVPEDAAIVPKPPALTWEEAAAMSFGGTTALFFLAERMALKAGERLLVIGASGAVGSAAVQVGKARGAHVTGLSRAENHALVLGIGADAVHDYRDWAPAPGGYDCILDTAGVASARTHGAALRPGGRLGLVVSGIGDLILAPFRRMDGGKRVIVGTAPERAADLATLSQLAAAGMYRPVIGSVTPLDRIAEAHRITDSRHKVGSAVVRVAPDPGGMEGAS